MTWLDKAMVLEQIAKATPGEFVRVDCTPQQLAEMTRDGLFPQPGPRPFVVVHSPKETK